MAKYYIHTCPDRYWYVTEFLIPSMLAQGIKKEDITVYNDEAKEGTLQSYMRIYSEMPNDNYGTWHLQDDVVISRHFRERTEQYDDGLVCGFCAAYQTGKPHGVVDVKNLWYSYPCIRVPNILATECARWFYQKASKDKRYESWIEANKFADEFFKVFLNEKYPDLKLRNLSPNLVNHIDYMLGGSTINKNFNKDRTSLYWNEDDVVRKLQAQINERNH